MNCTGFEAVLSDLVRGRLQEETVRAQALEHTSVCPQCARRLAEETALSKLFRLASSESQEVAPEQVETKLIAALHNRQTKTVRTSFEWFSFRKAALLPACMSLLAILVLIALAEFEIRRWNAVQDNVTTSTQTNEPPAGAAQTAAKDLLPERPAQQIPQALREAPSRAALPAMTPRRPAAAPAEIATDFIALTSAADLASMESGQLVKVQLPRSALASYGLPFNQELVDKPVSAQVLVGQDGVARAIRFLREPDARLIQTGSNSKR